MSRILPILLIVLPIVSFFVSKEALGPMPSSGRGQFLYVLLDMPLKFKGISISIGIIWLLLMKKK